MERFMGESRHPALVCAAICTAIVLISVGCTARSEVGERIVIRAPSGYRFVAQASKDKFCLLDSLDVMVDVEGRVRDRNRMPIEPPLTVPGDSTAMSIDREGAVAV